MDLRWWRFGVWSGLLAPVVFMVLYSIAAIGDPDYIFFRNYLSDLGVGPMAPFFNAAVIIAGGLTIPFALLALRPTVGGGDMATLGVVLTMAAGVFLMLVGIFPDDTGNVHFGVTIAFFVSMMLALIAFSLVLHVTHALGRGMTKLTQVLAVIMIALFIAGFNPQTETVSVLVILAWGLAAAVTLLRLGADADTY